MFEFNTVTKLRSGGYRLDTGAVVPDAPGNRHYQQVQEWIAEGNTPLDDIPSDTELTSMIDQEADSRIDAVLGGSRAQRRSLARAARLNAEHGIKGRLLTTEEKAEVDQLIALDDWVKAVRDEAERFIADDLPTLTEDEKLNFDPATDIQWPSLT